MCADNFSEERSLILRLTEGDEDAFYYNRPQWKNDPMGEGPVLRALVEMIDAPKYTEIKAEQQYDKIK